MEHMKTNALVKLITTKEIYPWYYMIVVVGYVLTLLSTSVHPGVIASALLVLLFVQQAISAASEFGAKDKAALNTIDLLAVIYFVYNLLSGVWCTRFGMPFSVWAGEFSTGIFTMVFYVAGRRCSDEKRDDFYEKFIWAVYLVGALGLVLFILAPKFYLDYLFNYNYISKADAPTMRIRMISVVGSILVGYLSVCGMLASSRILLKSVKNKFSIKGAVYMFMGLAFAFLSNQRSAMVVALLVLVYVNFLIFFTYHLLDKKWFVAECIGIVLLFAGICVIYFGAILKVYYRLVSLPGAIGQRSDQWIGAINNMCNLWLGNGLGANGHRAAGICEHLIADGGLAKLFVEMGILGTSVFVYMMILSFKYGLRNLRINAAEVGIVAITLLQSIGSNILEFQLATPIFWFALGVIARTSIKEENIPSKKGGKL